MVIYNGFAKLRAMRAIRASLTHVPTCPHTNMPTCQKRANFSFLRTNMLTCQFFNLACQWAKKRAKFSSTFRKKIFFNFWIFQLCLTLVNFNNIWAILENLSREIKNLNFDICKISTNFNFKLLRNPLKQQVIVKEWRTIVNFLYSF